MPPLKEQCSHYWCKDVCREIWNKPWFSYIWMIEWFEIYLLIRWNIIFHDFISTYQLISLRYTTTNGTISLYQTKPLFCSRQRGGPGCTVYLSYHRYLVILFCPLHFPLILMSIQRIVNCGKFMSRRMLVVGFVNVTSDTSHSTTTPWKAVISGYRITAFATLCTTKVNPLAD